MSYNPLSEFTVDQLAAEMRRRAESDDAVGIEMLPAAMLLEGMHIVPVAGFGSLRVNGVTDGGVDGVPTGYIRADVESWGFILKANDDIMPVRADWVTTVKAVS